ncbi:hypothetical protein K2173_002355 [Erythroxylum novogranatense]|uniref:BURP domain-containing protein n=1 Tax=Erythroxylum novogranatense TaxID=1862640 RepID=A0AAV8T9W8_9ROSI|nr:hypothetical protein K2173_002355 [Erythroxylum novogranatense]
MSLTFLPWKFIICVLLVPTFLRVTDATSRRKWKQESGDTQEHDLGRSFKDNSNLLVKHIIDNSAQSAHLDHMDPSFHVFFTLDDLKVGKTTPFYISIKDPSSSPHLLSRSEATLIPFSSEQLPNVLESLSLSKDSPQAKAMEYTLRQCELESMKGETKFCATSLESMLDFAQTTFGLDTKFRVLTTNHLTKPTATLQNYTILEEPKEIVAKKMIGCHIMPYPYVVYYCHSQEGGNRLFEFLLGGKNGERVKAAGVCHVDTSQWDSDNVSFRVLNIEKGTSPVCHIFQADDMVWIPLAA